MIKLSVFINALHYVTSITRGVTQYLFKWEHCMQRDQNIFLWSGSHITLVIVT